MGIRRSGALRPGLASGSGGCGGPLPVNGRGRCGGAAHRGAGGPGGAHERGAIADDGGWTAAANRSPSDRFGMGGRGAHSSGARSVRVDGTTTAVLRRSAAISRRGHKDAGGAADRNDRTTGGTGIGGTQPA